MLLYYILHIVQIANSLQIILLTKMICVKKNLYLKELTLEVYSLYKF